MLPRIFHFSKSTIPHLSRSKRFFSSLGKGHDILQIDRSSSTPGLIPIVLEGYTINKGFTITDYNNFDAGTSKIASLINKEEVFDRSMNKFDSTATKEEEAKDEVNESGEGGRSAEIELNGSIIVTNFHSFLWRSSIDEKNPSPAVNQIDDVNFWNPLNIILSRSASYPNNYDLVVLGVSKSLLSQRMKPSAIKQESLLTSSSIPPSQSSAQPEVFNDHLRQLTKTCKSQTLPLEIMEIGRAMATFNILVAEGRNVLCALVCVDEKSL